MEPLYLLIVGALFLFAIFDLIVGVSNDAVNFLNSAVGSKAGTKRTIFIIASVGILVGALFSSGMMEVARKGIFHPELFSFAEIMLIFLAVMITDVLLLDFYNTLKLPTSTTVSIVFELLGAAFAVALIKTLYNGDSLALVHQYINSERAVEIIFGILASVVIAFFAGAIVQYIVRFVFTFEYTKRLSRFGAIRGGIAITSITYFLLIKGAKGSSLLSSERIAWIETHTPTLLGIMFAFRTAALQICTVYKKINIPKFIVLVGTFALAMAFAGNDLVNFIGVPLAGFSSYMIFLAEGGLDPTTFLMEGLSGKVPTPFYFLLMAGLVMVLTLRYSSKAHSVTETEIGLGRDSVGYERFEASYISRILVGTALQTKTIVGKYIPQSFLERIKKRFKRQVNGYKKDVPAFDLIRASVNLTVASILIAFATSMKLPLSTTYVTFMVAMGASLADGVRGRDSAVYRITGVLTVIGGWFLTALSAFVAAGVIVTLLYFSDIMLVGVLILLVFIRMYYTHIYHRKQMQKDEKVADLFYYEERGLETKASQASKEVVSQAKDIVENVIEYIGIGYEKGLTRILSDARDLEYYTQILKTTIHETFAYLPKECIEHGHYYIKVVVYLRKIANSVQSLVEACRTYVINHHPPLIKEQVDELTDIRRKIGVFISLTMNVLVNDDDSKTKELIELHEKLIAEIDLLKKRQLQRIKGGVLGVRNSSLYLTILVELQNLAIYYVKLVNSYTKLLVQKNIS